MATVTLSAGDRFLDRYRIEALLGMGGMGAVYRAFDEVLQAAVALKLPILTAQSNTRNEVILREAKVLASLNHPGIPKLLQHGTNTQGLAFLSMELIEGTKLSELLTAIPLPPFEQRLGWVKEIAAILCHVHRAGLVYADLKPDNLIVRSAPRSGETSTVTLIDFGTCRSIASGNTEPGRGTVDYMSPEQHLQGNLDARSDIFSFGIVAYELLTGLRPFTINEGDRNAQRAKLGNLIATEDHTPARETNPDVWSDVSTLIDVCLEKLPENRFSSMDEVLEGLQHADGSSMLAHLWRSLSKSIARSVHAKLGFLGKTQALGKEIKGEESR